jgi:hypothetical protein
MQNTKPGALIKKNARISRFGLSPAKHLFMPFLMQKMKLFPPNTLSPSIWLSLISVLSYYRTIESLSKELSFLLFSILLNVYWEFSPCLNRLGVLTLLKSRTPDWLLSESPFWMLSYLFATGLIITGKLLGSLVEDQC